MRSCFFSVPHAIHSPIDYSSIERVITTLVQSLEQEKVCGSIKHTPCIIYVLVGREELIN